MGYCTISDVRAEGVTAAMADDVRVQALIDLYSELIDRTTGWWFEERALTVKVGGRNTKVLHLPAPATEVTEVRRMWRGADPDQELVLDPDTYVVYSYDLPDHRFNPKVHLIDVASFALADPWEPSDRFRRGVLNYEVDGTFGFVEDDGVGGWRTPYAVQRACMLLVVNSTGQEVGACDDVARDQRSGKLRSFSVQGRSATWGGSSSVGSATGVEEADRLLAAYRSPMRATAA